MRFERLEVSQFRNLSEVQLDLGPGVNFFYGENGAGKTALLEAAYLLCRGRSFRTQNSRGLIQTGTDRLLVRGRLTDDAGSTVSLAISKDRRSRTELRRNGSPERRLSEVARLTPLQVMLPDVAELVFGSPSGRRSWLDWGMFHVKPDYLERLRSYLRAVRQRNALIRDQAGNEELAPWSQKTAELGERISADRYGYLATLEDQLIRVLRELAPELAAELKVDYYRGWGSEDYLDKLLGERHPREVKYGSTLWGPHRADVRIRMHDTAAASVLSRGQGKLVASAMQIAQAALLGEQDGRSTVFLIDDIGAELDLSHNERFFGLLDQIGGQILATTTQDPQSDGPLARIAQLRPRAETIGTARHRVFHVEHGSVRGV